MDASQSDTHTHTRTRTRKRTHAPKAKHCCHGADHTQESCATRGWSHVLKFILLGLSAVLYNMVSSHIP